LHHVISDISGVTGLKIVRAIVAGERDPDLLWAGPTGRPSSEPDTCVQTTSRHSVGLAKGVGFIHTSIQATQPFG